MKWPKGKKFAFTIIDDADYGFLADNKIVYSFLMEKGIISTKTVWVYESRDNFKGECIENRDYLKFIYELIDKGYEIALHNVGSGAFRREEIFKGLENFKTTFGSFPKFQINHANNIDNIYWGSKRFVFPINLFYKIISKNNNFHGEEPASQFFWGDFVKANIKYIRNLTFKNINTIKNDPKMPYKINSKKSYSNYWFSASDGCTIKQFNKLITKENIDRLEREGGACIVYTHFGYEFVQNKDLNKEFKEKIEYLSKKDAWFVPAGDLLDFLLAQNGEKTVNYSYLLKLNLKWLIDRIIGT